MNLTRLGKAGGMAWAIWLILDVQPLVAQPAEPAAVMGPPAPIVRNNRCRPTEPGEGSDDEVVVCGRSNDEDSPYRIPRPLREQGQVEDRHVSWDTQVRDAQALERFSGQTVGHSGMAQAPRQRDCEFRVARQELRDERPDCGRGLAF